MGLKSGTARRSQDKEAFMAWILLVIAGLFEVVWAYFMKQSHGFTRLTPTIVTFVTMFISFGLLSISMKTLPLGTAYAMWTGIGALGAFLVGVVVMGEPATAMRLSAAGLIVAGLALMKIATPT
jgi:quaternary ammonium compound-resistance protein SugE